MQKTRSMPKRGAAAHFGQKQPINSNTIKRLLKYITSKYKAYLIIVFIGIII